jgi:hypothetical protein
MTWESQFQCCYGSASLLLGLGCFYSVIILYIVSRIPRTEQQACRKATTSTQDTEHRTQNTDIHASGGTGSEDSSAFGTRRGSWSAQLHYVAV